MKFLELDAISDCEADISWIVPTVLDERCSRDRRDIAVIPLVTAFASIKRLPQLGQSNWPRRYPQPTYNSKKIQGLRFQVKLPCLVPGNILKACHNQAHPAPTISVLFVLVLLLLLLTTTTKADTTASPAYTWPSSVILPPHRRRPHASSSLA